MKDIVIKGRTVLREIFVLLGSIVCAEVLNLCSILHFGTSAVELVSMAGFVLVLGIIVYLLLWIVRLIVLLICKIFKIK